MEDVHAEPTGQTDDVDVDALLESIESPRSEIPMTAEPQKQETPKEQQTSSAQEIEFTWNGKQIKAPLDKATQWASQGYDYAQKMAEINRQKAELEEQNKFIREYENKYKPVDEYVRQNPEWWEHVQKSWEQRELLQQQQNPGDPVLSKVDQIIESKLQPISQFIRDQQLKEETARRSAEDQRLNEDITSIRKQYSNLDWDSLDAEGKSLEMKILEHANANQIANFRAAFRDFYHDHLVKIAEERGKEAVSKDIQKRTKLGLLGTSSTPKKQISSAEDVKNKSYETLLAEALAEIG